MIFVISGRNIISLDLYKYSEQSGGEMKYGRAKKELQKGEKGSYIQGK